MSIEQGEGRFSPEISERGKVIFDALASRRSYREFTTESIPHELIETILEAALNAPSSKNAQPWRFHVVTDRKVLQEIADSVPDPEHTSPLIDPQTGKPHEGFEPTLKASLDVMTHAPVVVFIENTTPFTQGRDKVLESPYKTAAIHTLNSEVLNIGATIGNLYTATEAAGLGGVFMADIVSAEPQVQQKLGVKGNVMGAFVFGHPTQTREQLRPKPPIAPESRIIYH